MDVVHLNQKQMADRWSISEAYEESCLATSIKTVAAQVSAG